MLDALDKVSKIVATLALPVVLLVIGNWYSASQKDKDLGQNYVELAIGILSEQPSEDNAKLREWAVQVVNRYAEIKIDDALAKTLITREALPSVVSAPLPSGFRAVEGERTISRIIVSDTQAESIAGVLAVLPQIGASYHYLVGTDGSVRSLVRENDIAFHTARANTDSIGIGVMHLAGQTYPRAQVSALAQLVGEIAGRYGIGADAVVAKSDVDPRKASDFATIAAEVRGGVVAEHPAR